MPPTPSRPRTASTAPSSSTSTPSSAGPNRPSGGKPAAGNTTNIQQLVENIEQLFSSLRKQIHSSAIIFLRKTIYEEHRYIIFYAINAGKANPLLVIPPEFDPSIGTEATAPLVSPEEWSVMVTSAEVEARRAQAEGTLVVPPWEASAGASASAISSTNAGGAASASRPASPAPAVATSSVPTTGAGSAVLGKVPGQPRMAVGATGGPNDASSPPVPSGTNTPVPASAPGAGSVAPTATSLAAAAAAAAKNAAFARSIMSGADLKRLIGMPSAEREEIFSKDPEIKRRYDLSILYFRTRKSGPQPNPPVATADVSSPAAQSAPGQAVPRADPDVQANNAASGSNVSIPVIPPIPIMGNPNFTLSQPPPPRSIQTQPAAGAPQASRPMPVQPGISGNNTSNNAFASSSSSSLGIQPTSSQGVEQQFGQYIPPPPRPPVQEENEAMRRKRKYREWVGELGSGLEAELGLDDLLNDITDKFIIEVTRAGVRLSKHRKSTKVEIKDLAFYLDKHYSMNVPGFDAIVPKRTHLPADTEERRRLRAVIPRLARKEGDGTAGLEAGSAAAAAEIGSERAQNGVT